MADVKVEKSTEKSERGVERQRGGGLARREQFWPSDLFAMDPFAMMRRLSTEMDRAFGTSFGLAGGEGSGWMPAMEIREEAGNLVVCADLPGINKEDVRVECTPGGLTIEGERKREHEETRGGFHRSERSYGRFHRVIPLPEGADVDKASAQFKDGVLEVKVPVPERKSSAREIPIQS